MMPTGTCDVDFEVTVEVTSDSCRTCGALVEDVDRHSEWHKLRGDIIIQEKDGEDAFEYIETGLRTIVRVE